jgi:virginiamycin B lyase
LLAPPSTSAAGLDRYQRLEHMHHTAWTAKDGLLGKPAALAQTTDGYLWIGTSNGLYRFDGVTFERYKPETGSLPAMAVATLLAVSDGGLWVGYLRGGLTFLAADGRVVNYSLDDGLPFGAIRSLAQESDGTVWVAATGGLARLEAGRWQSVRMDWNYPCRSAWTVFVDREGTLWVACNARPCLLKVHPDTLAVTEVKLPTPKTTVRRFDVASDGMIWFVNSGAGRLGRFNPKTGDIKEWDSPSGPASHPYAISILDNAVWYNESGVRPDMLVRFDIASETFQSWPIKSGNVYAGIVRKSTVTPQGTLLIHQTATNRIIEVTPQRR